MSSNIPPANVPMIDDQGRCTPEWYRYFVRKEASIEAGEVQAGTGLSGGGFVANGVELSVAAHGVGNAQLREGAACSVIGRYPDSAGQVADITADADDRVLCRQSGTLAFRDNINGVSVGATTPATGRFTSLRVDQDPTAAVLAGTHWATVSFNGVDYKVLLHS